MSASRSDQWDLFSKTLFGLVLGGREKQRRFQGTDLNFWRGQGWISLLRAADSPYHLETPGKFLEHKNVHIRDSNGCTPLIFACWNGSSVLVRELLTDRIGGCECQG
jgi:hypothetical protein